MKHWTGISVINKAWPSTNIGKFEVIWANISWGNAVVQLLSTKRLKCWTQLQSEGILGDNWGGNKRQCCKGSRPSPKSHKAMDIFCTRKVAKWEMVVKSTSQLETCTVCGWAWIKDFKAKEEEEEASWRCMWRILISNESVSNRPRRVGPPG